MSIQPDRHNFSVWRGATFRKVLTFHTTDEESSPRDLTGFTARMPIKLNGSVLVELTTGDGITLGGALGTITLFISDEDTTIAAWKAGSYGLFLTSPGGDTDQLLFGTFTIKGS